VLTEDMKRLVAEQRLCFAATVCPDGTPNVSPKGTTMVWDDEHLAFADLRSPVTVRNLRANPAIELNVIDPFARRGYRFKGAAVVHDSGDVLEQAKARLGEMGLEDYVERVHGIVLVHVEQALELRSPAYDLGIGEEELRREWRARYDELEAARAR
jgi:predicted pyridoxine 5'-phosphate oxidase superfamily flavin-nucleotide-binding protein